MKRKVIKQGNNTLTITLPRKWTQRFEIKSGDEIELEEEGGFLNICPSSYIKPKKTIEINLSKKSSRFIRSQIGRMYRYGYSTAFVFFDDLETFKVIKEATNNLIGADVTDVGKSKCTIKVFPTQEMTEDFEKHLVKMIFTLKHMFSIIKEDMRKNKFDNEPALNELRNNNWKIKDLILRNAFLQKIPHEDYSVLSHLLFAYEKIGTDMLKFYRLYFVNLKKINASKLKTVFDKTESFFDWFVEKISKKKEITDAEEADFRERVREFHSLLLNKSHKDKEIDHSFITMIYLINELLDSTVSYLSFYKNSRVKAC